jgi:hypothetical protein
MVTEYGLLCITPYALGYAAMVAHFTAHPFVAI